MNHLVIVSDLDVGLVDLGLLLLIGGMDSESDFISLVPKKSPHRVVGERVVMLPGVSLEILTTRCIELEDWTLKGLNDPYWRLYLPTAGEARVWTGEGRAREETQLVPGRAYLVAPRTTFSSSNAVPFSKWYVHFTLGPAGDRATPGIFSVELTEHMRRVVDDLKGGCGAPFPWVSAGLVSEGLRQLPGEIWTKRQLDVRVERAIEFMHANLNRKLTNEEVARAAGLSVRNLNHLFNRHLEMPPMRVLLDFRLDKACRLLRHGDDSIEQIAGDTGFPNRYYFSRMLKQHRGASPAGYRQGQV